MKSNFKTGMFLAVVAAACVFPFRAQADSWDKKTIITVDQPIQVSDTYLEPGTYVLKLVNSSNDRHIVQIFNRDQNHLINTVMAMPNYHLDRADRTQFTFWETPPGTARAMRAWFYPGDNYGQEFRYPTQLRQLAAVATPAPAPLIQEPLPAEPTVAVAPADPALQNPEVAAEVQAPLPAEEPVEIAQNSPPPPPALPATAPAPAPEAAADNSQAELPKTASPYPLIGLGGLLSAGLFALLRVKRLS